MSHIHIVVKNTLNKVFKNLASEFHVPVHDVQLGIYYNGGKQFYEVYVKLHKEKDIDISDYVGAAIDWSGGTQIINATISQAGANYAKELKKPIDDINIIMQYSEGKLPNTVLMVGGKKERNISIEKEFLA